MNVHTFQHVPFEGLGEIEPWMHEHGHRLTPTQFFREDALPDPENVDWLIVMGGPMNVYEYRNHPWLREEKLFIERMIAQSKCVLGICLGAQLIADVLGAKVYQNREKEIGWFPVTWRGEAAAFFGDAASPLNVFHWHGDTFDLPSEATLLAESEGCRHQAFSYGPSVVGLQFHLEMNPSDVAALLKHGCADLTPGRFVQLEGEMMRYEHPEAKAALRQLLGTLAKSALVTS